ncbi:MAG: arylsulfatase [Planctomycetota bacterium]|nr:MAG: arylsulfatase [Planctomycetota bacterium]
MASDVRQALRAIHARTIRRRAAWLAVWWFAAAGFAAAAPPTRPNVVIILCDDLGYADIGPFGATAYRTPNLDRMAAEGRKFTDFHSATAVCSASRVALLTGCYPERVGVLGALRPRSRHGLSAEELTLAELCRQHGYATGIVGKWHLGDFKRFLPLQHGFDEYYGLPYSNDMWPRGHRGEELPPDSPRRKQYPPLRMFEGNQVVDEEVTAEEQTELTRQYTRRAVDFIDRHHEQPFFLYVAHSMVHVPLFVSKEFEGKSGAGLFGDAVAEIDWSVGEILAALARHGVDDNTIVVFTSDNGPWLNFGDHAGSAGPLREGKGTMFEGGYRVPCIMRMPGLIPAGSVCDEFCVTFDLLPTIARALDAPLPAERKIDGRDIWPLVLGESGAVSPHEVFYCYYDGALHAVRDRRWKLHLPHPYRTLGSRAAGRGGYPVDYKQARIEMELFDLKNDVGETKNVASEHPEVTARLVAAAGAARAELGDVLTGRQGAGVREPGRMPQQRQR